MSDLCADFRSHHIEGYARAALEQGKDGWFSVPLLSHIEDNLWLGGCLNGAALPDDFRYVISLYPWEQYRIGPDTTRWEFPMYDSADQPDADEIRQIAERINWCLVDGKTLVHCQAGLNRSSLVAAYALMLKGRSAADAIELIRSKRCNLSLCNAAFEAWLLGSAA